MGLREVRVGDGNKLIDDFLYDLVKEEKLFVSGHFRINKINSARDWINLEKLFALDNEKFIEPITKGIFESVLMEYIKRYDNRTIALVGLNYYGAILASVIGYKYNLPFTYYFNEKNFVDKVENEMQDLNCKQLVLITDVMVFGDTLCDFVNMLYTGGIIMDDTRIDVIVLFERRPASDYMSKAYMHQKISEINIISDSFDIEICKKSREECLFIQDENMCQYKEAQI